MKRRYAVTTKGEKNKERILAALRAAPQTSAQLAELLGLGESMIWKYVDGLRSERQAYISGHIANIGRFAGRPRVVYSAGSKPDVEFVPLNIRGRKTSAEERRTQVLALLAEKPMTARQVAERLHVVPANALNYIGELRAAKQVYIMRWMHPKNVNPEGSGGAWAPVYYVGSRPDKPRPKGETSAERHARRKKDPAYVADQNRRRKLRYHVEKLRGKPQGIFAALGL